MKIIEENTKKRGRPFQGGRDPIVNLRMPVPLSDKLDIYISNNKEKITRSEAIRTILNEYLTNNKA